MKIKRLFIALAIFASVSMHAENCSPCWEFEGNLSALYWQTMEEGLDYVIINENGTSTINNNGSVKRVDFDWNPGFRMGVGASIPCRNQSLSASWTWLKTDGNSSASAAFPSALFPVWTSPSAMLNAEEEISAKVSLKLNMVDFLIVTDFCPQCFFKLEPFVGLKAAWINQNFSINANGGQSLGPFAFVLDDAISMKNDFWGVGPKVGFNSTWLIACGFSFFGNMELSVLYGEFDVKQNETVLFTQGVPETTYLDITDNTFTLSRVNLGLALGLRWERGFCSDQYQFYLEGAWEHQYFFGQNQLLRFTDDQNPGINLPLSGDLMFTGITITAGISF